MSLGRGWQRTAVEETVNCLVGTNKNVLPSAYLTALYQKESQHFL